PLIALGEELMRRGHQVQIAAFASLGPLVRQAGITFYCLPGDAYAFISNAVKPGASPVTFLHRIEKTIRNVADPFLKSLYDACVGADALVVTYFGSTFYSIAEKLNIPCFQAHFYPMDCNGNVPIAIMPCLPLGKTYNRMTYRLGYLLVGGLEKRYLTRWRTQQGMRARRVRTRPDDTVNGKKVTVLYAISASVLPRPKDWHENIHLTGFWQRTSHGDWTPPEDLQRFLAAGEKPVYIGFGSMTTGDMGEALRVVLKSLRKANLRAVLASGWGGMHTEIPLPSSVYIADYYIPHDWLFERMQAVVHHGGAGTLAAGLRAGLPTLVVPFGGDQPFWGSRVQTLGLGPRPLPRSLLHSGALSRALIDLTQNTAYRRAAEEMARSLRAENGAAVAADIIEKEIYG
ncbi:MAG: glycosyltransferase, partial [Clostridia bacterium]